ncbi:Beta-porphyranase A precursor [Planctomycetes bacterium MalM25]|nr:Beta-porphyranase A precursor [Planctomycetes bacterium MalM25]
MKNRLLPMPIVATCLLAASFAPSRALAAEGPRGPASDPANQAGWTLNPELSDEFNGTALDQSKWFVQGDGGEYYIWKGRPPSQYAAHNVYVEAGRLKIRSQWEPEFSFDQKAYADGDRNDTYGEWEGKPMPITTGGVVSKKRFLNGYMEVRTKASDSNMTCAFWALGYQSELDIYEQVGAPKIKGDIQENTWKASIHDWSPPAKRPTRRFGLKTKLPFRVADDFHVYGCEWGEDYLKLYLDGELYYETTQEKEGKDWVLTNPIELYFDSEIFVWLGLPHKEELPSFYEIDYVRVWQKPQPNLLDRAFFGFEGPILYEDAGRPLTLLPESSVEDRYQKFWRLGSGDGAEMKIVRHEQASQGTRSLKLSLKKNAAPTTISAASPEGAVSLEAGDHRLSLDAWVTPEWPGGEVAVTLGEPTERVAFEVGQVTSAGWVPLEKGFTRTAASSKEDRLAIEVTHTSSPQSDCVLYLDGVSIERSHP